MVELISYYRRNKLLSKGGNAKIDKNELPTYNLSLLPHSLNSKKVNLCTFSTKECRDLCLNFTGRGKFTKIQEARRKKTDFYIDNRKDFLILLSNQLASINEKHEKSLVRLNTFSDINWEKELNKLNFSTNDFSNIIFYDYTKNPNYIVHKTDNQEFTYSYSGYNWKNCELFLKNKECNVAVVFEKFIPDTYKGFEVLNGDESDMRLKEYDGVGKIIGLKLKGNNKNFKNFVVKQ